MKVEQKRLEEQQEIERQEVEEARIAKAKAEAFACRRCPAKYPSNTKLHEHVRNHHAKKPKPAISSVATPPSTPPQSIVALPPTPPPSTPPHSVASLSDIPNPVTTPKPQQTIVALPDTPPPTPPHSVTSPPRTPKRVTSPKPSSTATKSSLLSDSAPEFVPQHSESASPTPPYKPAAMRPTPPSNSTSKTPSKPHLTIEDLHRMFAEKNMRAKLFASQNSPFSPGVSAPRQARITSYFLPASKLSKSTKSEAFTSMHAPMKQSARASPPRSPFRPPPYSPSAPFFSTTFYSSSVCWRCQAPLATYLHSNECLHVAGKAEIPMGRRGRRLF